jgi:hypothetical protein
MRDGSYQAQVLFPDVNQGEPVFMSFKVYPWHQYLWYFGGWLFLLAVSRLAWLRIFSPPLPPLRKLSINGKPWAEWWVNYYYPAPYNTSTAAKEAPKGTPYVHVLADEVRFYQANGKLQQTIRRGQEVTQNRRRMRFD